MSPRTGSRINANYITAASSRGQSVKWKSTSTISVHTHMSVKSLI